MNNVSQTDNFFVEESSFEHLQLTLSQLRHETETFQLIRALSDPTKTAIFFLLNQVKELPVKEISNILSLSASTISHALADLKKLGLVECRNCGQLRCYFLKPQTKERKKVLNLFQQTFINLERNSDL